MKKLCAKILIKTFALITLFNLLFFQIGWAYKQAFKQPFMLKAQYVNEAIAKQDTTALNSLLDKKFGLLLLTKNGVMLSSTRVTKFTFDLQVYPYNMLTGIEFVNQFQSHNSPIYDCDALKFSPNLPGIYIADAMAEGTQYMLQDAVKQSVDMDTDKGKAALMLTKRYEERSKRVTVMDKDNRALILYFYPKDNDWVFIAIDLWTGDCDA